MIFSQHGLCVFFNNTFLGFWSMGDHDVTENFLKVVDLDRVAGLKQNTYSTMWGPRSIAKLVHITPISLWFMVLITIVIGANLNQQTSLGGGHIVWLPSGKQSQKTNWKDPPFLIRVNQLFLLPFSIAKCNKLPEGRWENPSSGCCGCEILHQGNELKSYRVMPLRSLNRDWLVQMFVQ